MLFVLLYRLFTIANDDFLSRKTFDEPKNTNNHFYKSFVVFYIPTTTKQHHHIATKYAVLSHSKCGYARTFPQCISVRAFGKLFLETARSAIVIQFFQNFHFLSLFHFFKHWNVFFRSHERPSIAIRNFVLNQRETFLNVPCLYSNSPKSCCHSILLYFEDCKL